MESENSNRVRAWLLINQLPYLGPVRFHQLQSVVPDMEMVLDFQVDDFVEAGVTLSLAEIWAEALRHPSLLKRADDEMALLSKGVFQISLSCDSSYPTLLRQISAPPPVLYFQGSLDVLGSFPVGVVGTRHPTPYGEMSAKRIARELVSGGCSTVSGLARGIDTVIHTITQSSKGKTIAVLGNGLGSIYPKENAKLQRRIAEEGCLISEFHWSCGPEASHFPRRNRIIAGLSTAVIVVEAGKKSGALITARDAADQGRDVYAVPGPIESPMSWGCHYLLKNGAKLYEDLSDLKGQSFLSGFSASRTAPKLVLSPTEEAVYSLLDTRPLPLDQLVGQINFPIEQLHHALLSLELKDAIKRYPGSRYGKSSP